MRARLNFVSLLLFVMQGWCVSYGQRALSEFDLRYFGLAVPAKENASSQEIKLLFLTPTRIVILTLGGRVAILDAGRGVLLKEKQIDSGLLQRQSDSEFALVSKRGTTICNLDLICREGPYGQKDLRVLADGSRTVLPDGLSPRLPSWVELDQSGSEIGSYRVDFIGAHHQPVVSNAAGDERYRLSLKDTPGLTWDAAVITSVQGHVFGLEWKTNTWVQLLNPLACIDSCPPEGKQHLTIFSSVDGRLVRSFTWDPRPWNLYVVPSLSLDGKLVAVVRGYLLTVLPVY